MGSVIKNRFHSVESFERPLLETGISLDRSAIGDAGRAVALAWHWRGGRVPLGSPGPAPSGVHTVPHRPLRPHAGRIGAGRAGIGGAGVAGGPLPAAYQKHEWDVVVRGKGTSQSGKGETGGRGEEQKVWWSFRAFTPHLSLSHSLRLGSQPRPVGSLISLMALGALGLDDPVLGAPPRVHRAKRRQEAPRWA